MTHRRIMSARARGFTVIELMIAMLLGLVITAAILIVFLTSRSSFGRDETIHRMHDDARQAVRSLTADLSVAGHFADLMLPSAITLDTSLSLGTDCGPAGVADWIYRAVAPGTTDSLAITSVDNATGTAANAAYSCIEASELEPGTDVVAVKRVAGLQATGPLSAGNVYLRTNGTLGLLYEEPEATPPAVAVPVPFTEWEYRPSIYYVRNFASTADDGVPTLCRKTLAFGDPPTMQTECLAQGIEDLQIEFGLDGDGDGRPNVYVPDPTLEQLQTAVSAQISVLARSAEADLRYTNEKTYSISNAPAYTPGDNFYRRVYSVTVGLHNLRSLRKLRGRSSAF